MPFWKKVRLGELLAHRKQFIHISDEESYKLCRVQTQARGVVLRERKRGADIKTKAQQVCKSGDLIFAEIDARFGGYGLVPAELDGAIVSSHYFLYEVDTSKIEKQFLEYCLQMPWFLEQIAAKGSTNYAAIRAHHVLGYEIPLPTLLEQQEVVSRIEEIKKRTLEICSLRSKQKRDARGFYKQVFDRLIVRSDMVPLGEILIPKRWAVDVQPNIDYKQVTVRLEHKGVVLRGIVKGSTIGSNQFLASSGDFIISKIDARNGAMGFVPDELNGAVVTNDFPLYCFIETVNPKYFRYFIQTSYFDKACKDASEGTTNRRRLKTARFNDILVPIPHIEDQNKIVESLEKLRHIQEEHSRMQLQIDELLPALLSKIFFIRLSATTETHPLLFPLAQAAESAEVLCNSNTSYRKRAAVDAYVLHTLRNDRNLHRTKLEKINHLLEYYCEIPLGRTPVRDAAGPNDFESRLKVEALAAKEGIYTTATTQLDGGFKEVSYTLAEDISGELKMAEDFFGERTEAVDKLLHLLKPLSTKQSEVIATLYGSWNDSLLHGKQPTDDEIIQDVRYNWHKSKKAIALSLWEWGLRWLRDNGIVPQGRGKLVEHKKAK